VSETASADDLMIVNAARRLGALAARGSAACFVGIGLPSTAANLARRLYDPPPVLIYESGCIGSKPTTLPLSIGDGELGDTADAVVGVPEIFAYWLQAGRIDIGFLGGAPEIAASAGAVMVIMRQSSRAFVERCDFRSSVGFGDGPGHRQRLGLRGAGPQWVITDLGILEPDHQSCELTVTALHPGVTVEQCREATGWPVKFAADLAQTAAPTSHELAVLRELQAA
jgi:glutaconate CoA-transferase, subunit B